MSDQTPKTTPPIAPKSSFAKTLLPVVGLVIVSGLFWVLIRGCQQNPTPIAAPAPQIAEQPAFLPASLSFGLNGAGDSLTHCMGTIGSATLGEQIKAALFGDFADATCRFDIRPQNDITMPTLTYLPQLVGFVKGVPGASIAILGKDVHVNAADSAARDALIDKLRIAFPDLNIQPEPELDVAQKVKDSITAARAAIQELNAEATADELLHALNLQIINFATDSDTIPDDNKAILDTAAAHLKRLPDAVLLITGHTDDSGAYEYNQQLSEKRAAAVRDYLISQGVSESAIHIKGASSDNPVASNATEQGRFANRRIEFTLYKDDQVITEPQNTLSSDAKTAAQNIVSATEHIAENIKEATSKK